MGEMGDKRDKGRRGDKIALYYLLFSSLLSLLSPKSFLSSMCCLRMNIYNTKNGLVHAMRSNGPLHQVEREAMGKSIEGYQRGGQATWIGLLLP